MMIEPILCAPGDNLPSVSVGLSVLVLNTEPQSDRPTLHRSIVSPRRPHPDAPRSCSSPTHPHTNSRDSVCVPSSRVHESNYHVLIRIDVQCSVGDGRSRRHTSAPPLKGACARGSCLGIVINTLFFLTNRMQRNLSAIFSSSQSRQRVCWGVHVSLSTTLEW